MATEKSAEFERGGDNASVIAFYTYEKLRDANRNLDVKWAREMAARMGKLIDHSGVCGFLLMRLFLEPINARFSRERHLLGAPLCSGHVLMSWIAD